MFVQKLKLFVCSCLFTLPLHLYAQDNISLTSDDLVFVASLNEKVHTQVENNIGNEKQQEIDDLVQILVLNGKGSDSIVSDKPIKNQKFIRPVSQENSRISSHFGMRIHPISKKQKMHTGTDYAAPSGTPIYAAQSGVVIFSDTKKGYGKTVVVKHNERYSSLYGHTSKLLVRSGQQVKQGQIIALVGNTGVSTRPHLHFEIFDREKRINPNNLIGI